MTAPVLLWFRDDLRLSDHAALHAAQETGAPVLPVYIHDDQAPWSPGGAARWWLHQSLASLAAGLRVLGGTLTLRRGRAEIEIVRLDEETGAAPVVTDGMSDPAARATKRAAAARLNERGVRFHLERTATLFGPEQVKTKAGGPFGVYTPFVRACRAMPPPRASWSNIC